MGNQATSEWSPSGATDEEILKHIEVGLRPYCIQRRSLSIVQKVKQLNPQREEDILEKLKKIQRTSASGGSSAMYVPGWNDEELKGQSQSEIKEDLVRLLLENDHNVTQKRWQYENEQEYRQEKKKAEEQEEEEEKKGRACSYMEAIVACLYYAENLEMQLVAAHIVKDLCASRPEEIEADVQSLTSDGGQSSKHYHPTTQLLRFRFGLLGTIPELVRLAFQGQNDLQLLGTRSLAGLAMHPANRAAIATSDGLRPLVIHTLSHDVHLRSSSVLALNRLASQPHCGVPLSMYAPPMDPLSKISASKKFISKDGNGNGNTEDNDNDNEIQGKKGKRCHRGHKILSDDTHCSGCNTLLDERWRQCLQRQAGWFDKQPPATIEGIVHLSKCYRDATSFSDILPLMNNDFMVPSIPNANVRKLSRHKTILELDGIRSLCTLLLRTVYEIKEDENIDKEENEDKIDTTSATSTSASYQQKQDHAAAASMDIEAAAIHAHDRWVTILALHALQSLLVHGERGSERLCNVRVELPHAHEDEQNNPSSDTNNRNGGEGDTKFNTGPPVFTGLHLVLLMSLPPRDVNTRTSASRVLVQLARESDNIASFQSFVEIPSVQRRALINRFQSRNNIAGTNKMMQNLRPTCIDLVSAVSHDKDAEITANSVIAMLHLSVDERTTSQLLRLQALPKICSLVGAASANVAVQRRAMYALCTVGTMCASMNDEEYARCYVPQVVLPLLIAMSNKGRDWIVRREALRGMAVFCLRRDCAHHIIRLNGVESLMDAIHQTSAACILHETNGIDSISTLGGDGTNKKETKKRNTNQTSNEENIVQETPTYEIATVVEQLSIKVLAMFLMYEELVTEVRRRVKADQRFNTLEEIFGERIGHIWDISELIRAKKRGEKMQTKTETKTEINHATNKDTKNDDDDNNDDDEDDMVLSSLSQSSTQKEARKKISGRHVSKELRIPALLGLGLILRPEHITDHLPHWLDLYVHWLRSTNTYTLQVMCIAALAHVAICPRSHLRLVEEALDEDELLRRGESVEDVQDQHYTEPRDR